MNVYKSLVLYFPLFCHVNCRETSFTNNLYKITLNDFVIMGVVKKVKIAFHHTSGVRVVSH